MALEGGTGRGGAFGLAGALKAGHIRATQGAQGVAGLSVGFGFGGLCCGSLGLCCGDALGFLLARVGALVDKGLQAARFGAGVVKVPGAHVANRHAQGAPV